MRERERGKKIPDAQAHKPNKNTNCRKQNGLHKAG